MQGAERHTAILQPASDGLLANIQLLRGLAALAVVVYHTNFTIFGGAHTEFQAVSVFFVISGFIMTHLSRNDAGQFMVRRLTRVVPIYWVVTMGSFAWTNQGFSNPLYVVPLWAQWSVSQPSLILAWIADHHGLGSVSAWSNLVKSLLFVPYINAAGDPHPILGVGWTLNLEMFFYVAFAVALKMSQRWAPLVVCALLLGIKVGIYHYGGGSLPWNFYAHPYTTYFCWGVGAYYAWRMLDARWLLEHRNGLKGMAMCVGCLAIVMNLYPGAVSLAVPFDWGPLYGVLPFGLVLSGLTLEKAGLRCRGQLWMWLGDISFVLYLVHPVVLDTQRSIGQRWAVFDFATSSAGFLLALALSLMSAWVLHRYIERPLIDALRRQFKMKPPGTMVDSQPRGGQRMVAGE